MLYYRGGEAFKPFICCISTRANLTRLDLIRRTIHTSIRIMNRVNLSCHATVTADRLGGDIIRRVRVEVR